MKKSLFFTTLFAVQVFVFITLPIQAAVVDLDVYSIADSNVACDADSEVQALVEYEEQMAERSAQLEAMAILLQADENDVNQLEQAKVSISPEASLTPGVHRDLKIEPLQKNTETEMRDEIIPSASKPVTAF